MLKSEDAACYEEMEDDVKSLCVMLEEVSEMVHNLPENHHKVIKQLDMFLEEPTAIDPFLGEWMKVIMARLREVLMTDNQSLLQTYLHVLYQFSKVRGFKSIRTHHLNYPIDCVGQFFPHDLQVCGRLLVFCIKALSALDEYDWMVRTMCLYWCSLAVMVPFKLNEKMVEDLLVLSRERLLVNGRECKGAAMLLAALIKRETDAELMVKMLEWLKDGNNLYQASDSFKLGALTFLAALTKDRCSSGWIDQVQRLCEALKSDSSMLSKKLVLKIRRQLASLFPAKAELTEEAIEMALRCLGEKDTLIRWSAAKGLGSISKQLDPEERGSLIHLLLPAGNDIRMLHPDHLHGLALAFAELLRNGIDCLEVAEKLAAFTVFCLRFEVSKGTFAVGSQVRDAACYICWAWIRYSGRSLKPELIGRLASGLLAMSLFDREISCRRAASAAFQELVGRSQSVPHGIQIIGQVHFFSISNKERCYGELARACLSYGYYREGLMKHLLEVSLKCFDKSIRCLASTCLAQAINAEGVVYDDTESVVCDELDELVAYALSEDFLLQHSGLITLGQLLLLSSINLDLSAINEKMAAFAQVPSKSLGYELLAESWLHFIACAATTLAFSECWIEIVKTALSSRFTSLHKLAALHTLPSIVSMHGNVQKDAMTALFRTVLLPGADKSPDINVQRGYALALGAMPSWLVLERQKPLTALLTRLAQTTSPVNDIERRCNIIGSIQRIFAADHQVDLENRQVVYEVLIDLLDDYSTDSRGDVGSLIREAAIKALASMNPISEKLAVKFLGKLLGQAVDRLDRVRWTAFEALRILLKGSHRDIWTSALGIETDNLLCGKNTSMETFMRTASVLLHQEQFRKPLLLGWINSAGSTNPIIGDPSWAVLKDHLGSIEQDGFPYPGLASELLLPDNRLCLPFLIILQKYFQANRGSTTDSIVPNDCLVQLLINLTAARNCRACPIQTLIEAFKVLKAMALHPLVPAHLDQCRSSYPYPRIQTLLKD